MISTVSSSSGLLTALKSARAGDTIQLSSGTYDLTTINGFKFTGDVTITSADSSNQAVMRGLSVTNSTGLTFTDLELVVSDRTGMAASLSASTGITFDRVSAHNSEANPTGNGIFIRGSSDITVTNSDISDVGAGISHLNSEHLTFSNNKIHGMTNDGIRGGGSSFVTISGNQFSDFRSIDYAHNDAIQFWTVGTTTVAHDLVITDNTLIRGDGNAVQGIFMGAQSALPFENVTITGNAFLGSAFHGISLDYVKNAVVTDNLVQGYKDMTSWIQVTNSTNSRVGDNDATSYKIDYSATGLMVGDNVTVGQAAIGDMSKFNSWLSTHEADNDSMVLAKAVPGVTAAPVAAPTVAAPTASSAITSVAPVSTPTAAGDINGTTAADKLNGTSADNVMRGGEGADSIQGSGGNDTLHGDAGGDTLRGGDGFDKLFGGDGNDFMYGDAGADTLSGEAGVDMMWGGKGADVFVTGVGFGRDWASDFNVAEGDKVQLATGTHYKTAQVGANVLLYVEGNINDFIGLVGVKLDTLGDFITYA